MSATLHHVHDPMCSWCWAFRPASDALFGALESRPVRVNALLGGLAPDSEVPMAPEMAEQLQATWRRIQQTVPGTRFDFAFWSDNVPRRSTWPSCRAVIAAASLGASERDMTDAIQRAYYLQARNPSDVAVLVALAADIGLDAEAFRTALLDTDTEQRFADHRRQAMALGVQGFPSLVLELEGGDRHRVPVDFSDAQRMLQAIDALLRA